MAHKHFHSIKENATQCGMGEIKGDLSGEVRRKFKIFCKKHKVPMINFQLSRKWEKED